MRVSTNPTLLSFFPGTRSTPDPTVTTQTLPFRALTLAGAVWVHFTFAGPGLHDPDCPHHLPGASGPTHHDISHDAPETPSDECRCLGVCVPGTLAGVPALRNDVPDVLVAPPARAAALSSALLSALLFASPAPAQQSVARVSATVLDASTGRPVIGAGVTAGRAFTLSAADGTFALALPPGVDRVTVERMGYAAVTVPLPAWTDPIRLEPSPYLLEHIAVDVRAGEVLAAGTSLALAVLDRADLDATGATSVAEALRHAEGVQDSRVGSWGSRPVVRGLSGERVAILIDGSRVHRACTFGMDQGLASVDPAQVDRVEIVSGPGTALYGSGNVVGVINVVTSRPGVGVGTSGELRMGASSAVPGGTAGATLRTGGGRYGASIAVDGSTYGDYRTPAGTVDGSSFRQITGDGKLDLRPADAQLLSLKAQVYAGRDIGWPTMSGAAIPEETRTSLSLDYGWQLARGVLDGVSLRAYRQRLDHHMTVDAVMQGPMGAMTSRADATSFSTTTGARAQLRLTPGSRFRADVGVELTRWFAEGTRWTESASGSMPPSTYTSRTWPAVEIADLGAFVQTETHLSDALTVSSGLRLDRVTRVAEGASSSSESVLTGNAGLRVDLGAGFGTRSSVGLGYRNPDPTELYGLALKPDGYVYRGRADLATERGLNTEASLSWTGNHASVSVTGFRNRLEDMVSLRMVPGEEVAGRPVREYVTVGSAVLRGVSGSAEAELPSGFGLRVGATYTRTDDEDADAPLAAIPPLTLEGALRRSFHRRVLRWIELEVQGADAQNRISSVAGEKATPAYMVVHARLAMDAAGARVTAGVENVLDREYRTHLDPVKLYRPGRNLFVRVSRRF